MSLTDRNVPDSRSLGDGTRPATWRTNRRVNQIVSWRSIRSLTC